MVEREEVWICEVMRDRNTKMFLSFIRAPKKKKSQSASTLRSNPLGVPSVRAGEYELYCILFQERILNPSTTHGEADGHTRNKVESMTIYVFLSLIERNLQ